MTASLLTAMAGATPALAQTLGQGSDADLPWWRVIGALLFCLALAAGAAFVLRDKLPWMQGLRSLLQGRKPGRLQLIESTRLTPHVEVCLIRYDEKELLLAVSPQGTVLLETRAAPAKATETAA